MTHEPQDSRRTENVEETQTPLEERLRGLDWPKPPPGMRERSLEEFRRKYLPEQEGAENGNGNGAAASDGQAEDADEPAAADPCEKRTS
jgi:hypothetical protein